MSDILILDNDNNESEDKHIKTVEKSTISE